MYLQLFKKGCNITTYLDLKGVVLWIIAFPPYIQMCPKQLRCDFLPADCAGDCGWRQQVEPHIVTSPTGASTVYHTATWPSGNTSPRKADGLMDLNGTGHNLWNQSLAEQTLTCRNSGWCKAEQIFKTIAVCAIGPLYTDKRWAH